MNFFIGLNCCMISFRPQKLRDFFFDPIGYVIFLAQEVCDFSLGIRRCKIFFGPRGRMTFYWAQEVARFFLA